MDRIYVVDSNVHSIKVFDNDGEYLFKFGVNGNEPGCLHLPTRVAFDGTNMLFVSDTGNNRIQVSVGLLFTYLKLMYFWLH